MIVGTIVKLKTSCLGNPKETKGICCHRKGKNKSEEKVIAIFENGSYGAFTGEEIISTLLSVGIAGEIMSYEYRDETQLQEDFKNGIFDKALGKVKHGEK